MDASCSHVDDPPLGLLSIIAVAFLTVNKALRRFGIGLMIRCPHCNMTHIHNNTVGHAIIHGQSVRCLSGSGGTVLLTGLAKGHTFVHIATTNQCPLPTSWAGLSLIRSRSGRCPSVHLLFPAKTISTLELSSRNEQPYMIS